MYICAFTKNVYYKNLYLLIDTKQTKKCTYTHTHIYICIYHIRICMYLLSNQMRYLCLLVGLEKSKD